MTGLVLAGGYAQIFLIKEIKSRGIRTVLADANPNCIAKPYADEFVEVNILDCDAVEAVAIEKKVDFVVAACADQVILTMARVSERLGFPCYIDYSTAVDVSDKTIMKKMCMEYDIPTAKSISLSKLDYELVNELNYPLVIKPADGYSAKGITKIFDSSELHFAFDRAITESRSKRVIIEEFIDGSEVTIDGYCENGIAKLLCVSNTEKLNIKDLFLAFRTWYPATVSENVRKKIEVTLQKIATACKLKDGPMHCQMLIDNENIYVLEFCARTGGGAKYTLLKRATGFDPFSTVVDLALGEKPHIEIQKPEAKYISNLFLYGLAGEFDHLEGFNDLLAEKTICDYCVFKTSGAKIKNPKSSSDRIASITIEADSVDEMRLKHNIACKKIKAISVDGADLINHILIGEIPYEEINGKINTCRW